MEDLRFYDYVMPNKFQGFDFQEMSLVIQELAKFHALTYSWLKYEGEQVFVANSTLHDFNPRLNPKDNQNYREGFQFHLRLGFDAALNHLKTADPNLHSHMSKIPVENIPSLLWDTCEKTDVAYFPVLMHGDLWINNIMIRYDKEVGSPVSTKFIDFQFIRRENIFYDLSMLIFTSTTPEFRAKHLSCVLEQYYCTFSSFVKRLGMPLPAGFSRGSFIDNFRSTYLPVFVFLPFAIAVQLGEEEVLSSNGRKIEATKFDSYLDVLESKISRQRASARLRAVGNEMIAEGII